MISDDQETMKQWVQKFGIGGPIVLVLGFAVQMFMFVVPNVLLMIISISIYGPFWGSVISLIGVYCSSSLGYLIGSYIGPHTVHKIISKKTQTKISDFVHRYGIPVIAITRLSSLANDSLGIVAGILRMTYWKYIAATLSGIIPLITLIAIYGENGKILNSLIWIGGASILGLVIYILIDRRMPKRKWWGGKK